MLAFFAQAIGLGFVAVMAAIVVVKMMTGGVNTKGLLQDGEGGGFSAGRLQLLVVTMIGAMIYFSSIVGAKNLSAFPPVPNELLIALGLSNAGYLGGKIYSLGLFKRWIDAILSRGTK